MWCNHQLEAGLWEKKAFLLGLYLPGCDARSTHGFLAVAFVLFVLQTAACCRAVLCLPAIPSAVSSTSERQPLLGRLQLCFEGKKCAEGALLW